MDYLSHACSIGKSILDQTNGFYVCGECGEVGQEIYSANYSEGPNFPRHFDCNREMKILEEIKDLLDRTHIPQIYAPHILKYLLSTYRVYNMKNVVFSTYKILNEKFNFNISLQALLNVTGLAKQPIFSALKPDENVLLDVSEMVERYCGQMKTLTFKDMTLIKEQIKSQPLTGHTPLTIIASNIYTYCKANKKKISVRQVSHLTSVSPISIQRYIKKQKCSFTQEKDIKQVVV